MIRSYLAAALLLTSLAPAAAAERRFSVTDFERVVVEGPYVVRLTAGRASSASASGPRAGLDRLSLDVSGETLRIRRDRQYWGGNPEAQEGPIEIELVTRILRSARIVGPGRLDVDRLEGLRVDVTVEGSGTLRAARVEADNLSIGVAGAGRIELIGTAESVVADIQGTGDLEASQLVAENARITTTTTGTIAMGVSETADVNALGLGNVTILGGPACTLRGANAYQVSCGDNPLDQRQ